MRARLARADDFPDFYDFHDGAGVQEAAGMPFAAPGEVASWNQLMNLMGASNILKPLGKIHQNTNTVSDSAAMDT